MCIALTSCAAGEGDFYPQKNEPLFTDTTNLPWVILRAVHRAARLDGVPTRARAVLAALARTVNAAKPFGEIYARRTLLSERAMQSERTFYRSLADLDAAGLIDRAPQRRYVEAGLFGRAYLYLTQKAAVLLGLIEEPRKQSTPTDLAQASSSKAKCFEPPHANVADGAIYKDLSPSVFQKRQPGQLPADLQRLRGLGFYDFLIFKLMREARVHGKRLSDVVETTWDHLKLAKAPINYLRALLRNPVDFAHLLQRRTADNVAKQARQQQHAEGQAFALQHAGRTFIDANNSRQFVIGVGGDSLTIFSVTERIGRQAAGWIPSFAEALRNGKLRPATALDLERFAHAQEQALGNAQPSIAPAIASKTPVTGAVRDHIAGLRHLLKVRRAAA